MPREMHSHRPSLEGYLDGRLEVPGTAAGPVSVSVLLDSSSGLTSISEGVYEQMQQQCPGKVLAQPYTGGITAEAAHERMMGIYALTYPIT